MFEYWQTYILLSGSFSGQDSDKSGVSMHDIQCLLDKEGASELVTDVIVSTKNDRIFTEAILLGIALLEGGNTQIQVLCLLILKTSSNHESICKVYRDVDQSIASDRYFPLKPVPSTTTGSPSKFVRLFAGLLKNK